MTGAFESGWQLVGLALIIAVWTFVIWRTAHPHQSTRPQPGRARSHVHTIHTPRLYDWENDQ